MALCDHFMEAETCADCRPRQPADRPQYGLWFEAAYYGRCTGCEETIRPGEMIRHDGIDGYLCRYCGDTSPGVQSVQVTGNLL
jgi:hypothetical protein